MKEIVGKIALVSGILMLLCATCAANPTLKIAGKMTDERLGASLMPYQGFDSPHAPAAAHVENDRGRTFHISMQNTGTQEVFFTKIKISFTQSGLTSLEKSENSFVYTDTRFAGETIEPKGYFNTSFSLTADNLNSFISNDPTDAFRHDRVRLELKIFNENQMLDSGWTAVIPLESSGISFPGNVKLPATDTFSFAPIG